jgi:hypothetical protein
MIEARKGRRPKIKFLGTPKALSYGVYLAIYALLSGLEM